jgi:endonuclease/exonuclease/phosphatase family metal-dependent hydrolase
MIEEQPMNVMTWNIRHALGNDDCLDVDRVIAVIRDANPDLVALQEVDRFWPRSSNQDQPALLASALGMDVTYGANLIEPASGSEYGTLILSRNPIAASDNQPFPLHNGFEARGLLSATIDTPDLGNILFLNTHLQVGSTATEAEAAAQRMEQAAIIAQTIDASPIPAILCGDFNATPESPELAPIRDRLTDVWLSAHPGEPGYTIPAHPERRATERIDMIHVSPTIRITACDVIDTPATRLASDHFAVLATLAPA